LARPSCISLKIKSHMVADLGPYHIFLWGLFWVTLCIMKTRRSCYGLYRSGLWQFVSFHVIIMIDSLYRDGICAATSTTDELLLNLWQVNENVKCVTSSEEISVAPAISRQDSQLETDRCELSVREMRASCVSLSVSWWMAAVMTPQRTPGNGAGNKATNYSGHDGRQWSVIRRVRHVIGTAAAVTELAMRHVDLSWLTENTQPLSLGYSCWITHD